ncbi:MAG TPA: hypothetical protein VFQ95_06620 [Rhodanobacteraceae bacterium]|nr:hypothetical protein [Rhodanobacteraceae bacterium]
MIWGLVVVALLAFALAVTTHSPGLMGLGLAVGFLSALAAAVLFIDRHVRASSRPEHMTPGELDALRSTLQKDIKTSNRLRPPDA